MGTHFYEFAFEFSNDNSVHIVVTGTHRNILRYEKCTNAFNNYTDKSG